MKILSDFKDFYDYLQDYYGIDNQLVFHRKRQSLLLNSKQELIEDKISSFEIVQYAYKTFIDKKNFEHQYDYSGTLKEVTKKKRVLFFCGKIYEISSFIDGKNEKIVIEESFNLSKYDKILKQLEEKQIVSAVIYAKKINFETRDSFDLIQINPILSNLGFNLFLSEQDTYQNIEMYLRKLKNTEKTISIDNKNKIIQAGFDLKTSFRKPKIKNKKH